MKSLFFLSALFAIPAAHGASRCAAEAQAAVEAKAHLDYPGNNFFVIVPNYNDTNVVNVATYEVSVLETADPSSILAYYTLMVDETCHVISGPTQMP